MPYVANPDTQPGKKNSANFNAIENQGIGNGVIPFYGNGTKYLVPMKNISKASKTIGILGSEGACKLDVYRRAGVSSTLDEEFASASSQAYLLNKGLVRELTFIALTFDSEGGNADLAIDYINGEEAWYKFTIPDNETPVDVNVIPQIDEENLADADAYLKMSLYTGVDNGTDNTLTLRDWDDSFSGGGLIADAPPNTTYYLKVFNLPTGSLSIVVEPD